MTEMNRQNEEQGLMDRLREKQYVFEGRGWGEKDRTVKEG